MSDERVRHDDRRDRRILTALTLALVGALAAAPATARAQRLKLATLAPDGSAWHVILADAASEWKSAAAGRARVVIYPGGVAGDDRDVVRKMREGVLHAAVLTAVGLADIDAAVYALSVPMMYGSSDELYCVLEGLKPRLEASMAERGFVVLSWADGGWVHFFTRTPVATPDDLRALKLFAWEGDAEATALWRSAGFDPVPLSVTEIATALESGAVTALGTPPQVAVVSRFYDHARNMTDLRWQIMLGAIVVTRDAWESLPPELRPALLAAFRKAGERLRSAARKSGERDVAAMRERGLNVVPVGAATLQSWRRMAEGLYPRIRGHLVPAEAFDEARRLRDSFRESGGRACAF